MIIPKSMLRDTVTVRPRTGNSACGPAFGQATSTLCYIEPAAKRITNARGEEITASARAVFLPDAQVKIGDAVTWQNKFYQVVDVRQLRPNGRTHHQEVYLCSAAGEP